MSVNHEQLLKALKSMKRIQAKSAAQQFVEDVEKGRFTRDQLVDVYNVIVQRLLSPE